MKPIKHMPLAVHYRDQQLGVDPNLGRLMQTIFANRCSGGVQQSILETLPGRSWVREIKGVLDRNSVKAATPNTSLAAVLA